MSNNRKVTFLAVNGADHFSILAPANQLIAKKILGDHGPVTKLTLSSAELGRPVGK
jgi:hypothetical protein